MPTYNLNGLGSDGFEKLTQALVKKIIGNGSAIFGAGRDGAREATFSGRAPYPSKTEQWEGKWIFQAKFHDTELLGIDKARKAVVSDATKELEKVTEKYKHPCDNYILITNVPLTSVPRTGTRARLEQDVFAKYETKIKNFAVWGADDIGRFLDIFPDIRTTFLHFIVPGDLIASLLNLQAQKHDETTRTIQAYLRTSFERDQYAQLDQAGDVGDDPVRLQQVFFELSAIHDPEHTRPLRIETRTKPQWLRSGGHVQVVRMLLAEASNRVVLVGGPGEGKSTVGQYLAQLHRATLLNKARDIALNSDYLPSRPRIPFRVILKDFGQWLAGHAGTESGSGTLDDYICDQVKILTARSIEPAVLHKIIGTNPILLVLDGLDEVTDANLKRVLIDRVVEFTERCQEVYKADLLVLATTRPTGYVEQFDPKRFVHLRLTKLETPQVLDYVERWTKAKQFDPAKAARVIDSMKECLADTQIRLMATTPLQVTILAVIVALGGTPPRQREALFNEYLEVIYKRETAKGKHIIQSSKERLIGLHKFIGYVLHEEATGAEATSAYLETEGYAASVSRFLKHQNPYAPADVIKSELRAMTKDAGDRLVLIVEPSPGKIGFELRSIQEFFAACHLLDTSNSTNQRYLRFESISRLSHWRNVALFFAGRVGRNYEGEVANLVEVCRDIDRDGPDRHLRRGSELALEMAADRPFGSNARGQRSLLEHGLLILEAELTSVRVAEVCDVLQRLPTEDVRDHIVPLLRQKIEVLDASRLTNFVLAAQSVALDDLAKVALSKMARPNETRPEFLRIIFASQYQEPPEGTSVLELLGSVPQQDAETALVEGRWSHVAQVLDLACRQGTEHHPWLRPVMAAVLAGHTSLTFEDRVRPSIAASANVFADSMSLETYWREEDPLSWPTPIARMLGAVRHSLLNDRPRERRVRAGLNPEPMAVRLPTPVSEGEFLEIYGDDPDAAMLEATLWVAHLWAGQVTHASLTASVAFLALNIADVRVRNYLGRFRAPAPNPVLDVLISSVIVHGRELAEGLYQILLPYAGAAGSELWTQHSQQYLSDIEEKLLTSNDRDSGAQTEHSPLTERNAIAVAKQIFPQELIEVALGHTLTSSGLAFYPMRPHNYFVKSFVDSGTLTAIQFSVIQSFVRRDNRQKAVTGKLEVLKRFMAGMRGDSPEGVLYAIPLLLRDGGSGVSDKELRRLLHIVGRLGAHFVDYTDLDGPELSSQGLRRLIELGLNPTPLRPKVGLHRVISNYSIRFLYHVSRRNSVTRPRFKGLAANHRELLESRDTELRQIGIVLLLVHPPASPVDFKVLDTMVLKHWDATLGIFLKGIVENSVLWHSNRQQWISVLTGWLDYGLTPTAKAVVAEELDRLLAGSDQSLRGIADSLGLPLQT